MDFDFGEDCTSCRILPAVIVPLGSGSGSPTTNQEMIGSAITRAKCEITTEIVPLKTGTGCRWKSRDGLVS